MPVCVCLCVCVLLASMYVAEGVNVNFRKAEVPHFLIHSPNSLMENGAAEFSFY